MEKTRENVMRSQSVHNLTKDVLELSKDKDIMDRYHDVKLALDVLQGEINDALYGRKGGTV